MKLLQDYYNNTNAIFLAHGYVGEVLGKTVHGVLMHSKVFNVVALVDREKVGQDTSKICLGVTKKVPIYKNIYATSLHQPKVMILIGEPSEKNIDEIKGCISMGLDIINSSFVFLRDFPEIIELAEKNNVRLWDLRDVKRIWKSPTGSILNIKAKVVFVTGTDCGLGKRTAAYELVQEAKIRGIRAAFAATGQTGLMLGCDGGIILDAILNEHCAGAVEELIVNLDKKGFELIFLEGQASLMHFGGSNSIVLLHASNPNAIVMVHDPSREFHAAYGTSPIYKMCSLQREIDIVESLYLDGGNRFKVVAVPTIGDENIYKVKELTSLPVADVRKHGGPAIILDSILDHLKEEYKWHPQLSMSNSINEYYAN
jgi:uncharacterized NAD-dependent epimerase/dehydratase family protein